MRKLLVAMFMTAMLVGVVGCGGEQTTPPPTTTTTPEAAPPADTPAPPAEPEK